jgi:hypothetical protein
MILIPTTGFHLTGIIKVGATLYSAYGPASPETTADPSATLGMTKGSVVMARNYTQGKRNRRSLHYAPPDFLSRTVALMICMRLSEKKSSLRDRGKDRPLMGLRPVLLNPRTLVRTWGTRPESV